MSQSVHTERTADLADPDLADPDLPAASVSYHRTFRASAEQVREARQFLAHLLGESATTDDAVLCLSELAANAARHSGSARPGGVFTVRAVVAAGRVRVEVHDDGGPWRQAEGRDDSGRGLRIVAELAESWGRCEGTGSRTVWFEIAVHPRPPPVTPAGRSHLLFVTTGCLDRVGAGRGTRSR